MRTPAVNAPTGRAKRLARQMVNSPTLPNIVLGGLLASLVQGPAPWAAAYVVSVGAYVFGDYLDGD